MDDGAFAVLDYKQRETKRNKETVSSIFFLHLSNKYIVRMSL